MNEWNDRMEDELWEPGSSDQPLDIERRLASLRFDPDARPLDAAALPLQFRPAANWKRRAMVLIATAAILIIAVPAGLRWRLTWPEGREWKVVAASAAVPATLPVGETLQTEPAQWAIVRVARLGWMRVLGDADVTLHNTGTGRHRLALQRGTLRVRVWAPPFSIFISTPAGEVIDMGCEFLVTASDEQTELEVLSGWVQLENRYGETLVPEGALSVMVPDARPRVPVFKDAASEFRNAVRAAETDGNQNAIDTIVRTGRPRDVLTLLFLATRIPQERERLLLRAHELAPVLTDDELRVAIAWNDRAVWRWTGALPLPSPKDWKRNWRDALRPIF